MKKHLSILALLLTCNVHAATGRIEANIQNLNGKAGEYVYLPTTGDKISYLKWDIKNVPILNLGYNYEYNNWEFSIRGRKNIGNNIRSGYMKDYDWFSTAEESEPVILASRDPKDINKPLDKNTAEKLAEEKSKVLGVKLDVKEDEENPGEYIVQYTPKDKDRGELSNFSKNKNYVKNIIGLDLTAKYYLKKDDKYKIAPMIGLNYDKYEFYALGGDQKNFIPGTKYHTLEKGSGKKGLTYKQRFMTPYLGLYFDYVINPNWEVSLLLKGSAWGRARAKDRHLERGKMESFEKYKSIKYLSSNIAIKYHLNESLTLKYELELTKYFKNKKSRVRHTDEDGKVENIKNLGGISNRTIASSFGFEYKF